MSGSMALEVAEIYEALGEHDRAELLRWGGQAPADRLRDLEDELEAEREQATELEDERDTLKSDLEDMSGNLTWIRRMLDGLPKLVDAVAAEVAGHDDCGDCAVTRLVTAVDEVRRAVRAALK